jgi:hypothetical protein
MKAPFITKINSTVSKIEKDLQDNEILNVHLFNKTTPNAIQSESIPLDEIEDKFLDVQDNNIDSKRVIHFNTLETDTIKKEDDDKEEEKENSNNFFVSRTAQTVDITSEDRILLKNSDNEDIKAKTNEELLLNRELHLENVFGNKESLNSGEQTIDNTLTLLISIPTTAKIGDTLNIYNNNTIIDNYTLLLKDTKDGSVRFDTKELEDGLYNLSVGLIHNSIESERSNSFEIFINAIPNETPVLKDIIDDVNSVTGKIDNNTTTDDNKPTITIELPDDVKIGNTLTIYDNNNILETYLINSDHINNKEITIELTNPLKDGSHKINATISDLYGNESDHSADKTFEVDTKITKSPIISKIYDDQENIIGELNNKDTTNDTKPTFTIDLPNGAKIGDTISLFDNGTEIESHTILKDELARGNITIELENDLKEGEHSFTTTLTDKSQNQSLHSDVTQITIDTTPSEAPIIEDIIDNMGTIMGKLDNNDITADTTPTFTIT